MPQSKSGNTLHKDYLMLLALLGSEPENPAKAQEKEAPGSEADREAQRRLALNHHLSQES